MATDEIGSSSAYRRIRRTVYPPTSELANEPQVTLDELMNLDESLPMTVTPPRSPMRSPMRSPSRTTREELFLGGPTSFSDEYVPDDDFLAGVDREMPRELMSELENDLEPIALPMPVPNASDDAFRGASWAYVRDPRAFLLPHDDPDEILPGQSRIGYTRFFLDPGARQALFDRSDDAIARTARITVGLFLESIGWRNYRHASGFNANPVIGIIGADTEHLILPIQLRNFRVESDEVAVLRPEIVLPKPDDGPKLLGVVQVRRFDRTEQLMWFLANLVDRAIRVAYMTHAKIPNSTGETAIQLLHLSTANALSARTRAYRNQPVDAVVDEPVFGRDGGAPKKQHTLTMPLPKEGVARDFYFSDGIDVSSVADPVEKVLHQLTQFAGHIEAYPPMHPMIVPKRLPKLRFAFNPPIPDDVSGVKPTVYLGELAVPVFEMPMDNQNAVDLELIRRNSPISARVGYTIGAKTDPNIVFDLVIFARWPIFAFIDAVHDLWQTNASIQTWNDVHFRFHDWYNAQWTIRERPPTYLYLMPAGLVRAILHSGRGVMRTAAADCLLALALGEYSLRPSVVAANLVEEICMLCASMQHAEYDFTYYLPARIASPSAFLSIGALKKMAAELEPEYVQAIEPARIAALLDAETRMIVAATIAMAYGCLLRTWHASVVGSLRAAAMVSPERGAVTGRAGKLATALQILDGMIEHTLSDISPAKFRLLGISEADEQTIRNSGGSNVTGQIGTDTAFARARFLHEIMQTSSEWHFDHPEMPILKDSPYLSDRILRELRRNAL